MSNNGVSVSDFNYILSDMGRTISYKKCTRTTDIMTGSETTTFATASNVTVIFFLEENKFIWDKEGLLSVGDAYIIAPTTVGIGRYDQFTIDADTYYIETVITRYVLTTLMLDYAVCFKVAGSTSGKTA
jgi:hypothetical protein